MCFNLGFKEFHDYFAAIEKNDPKVDIYKEKGIQDMKTATRQYARKQVAWIKNKLVPKCLKEHENNTGAIYLIDATNVDSVTDSLVKKVVQLAENFISNKPNEDPLVLCNELNHLLKTDVSQETWQLYTCETCTDRITGENRIFNSKSIWEEHLSSNTHKNGLKRIESLQRRDAYFAKRDENISK